MFSDILDQASRLRAEEQPFVLATVVAYKSPQSAKPGSKAIIRSDGAVSGWIGGGCVQPIVLREAKKALASGKPKLLSISPESAHDDWKGVESYRMSCEGGGSLEIYLEPVLPKLELLIVGRSPVAQTIADLGRLLDFKVTVCDPQATKDQFASAHLVINDLAEARTRINETTFVVVATLGNGDEEGLQAVVGTTPRYLGLVASRKKADALFEYLRGKGATDEQIGVIKCPAGLELGGETLPEIALSVMAEITLVRRAPAVQPVAVSITAAPAPSEGTDPICGMTVDIQTARYTSTVADKTFYFCCLRCKETFDQGEKG
jgi:xanthine dehydrogenase accessory factor